TYIDEHKEFYGENSEQTKQHSTIGNDEDEYERKTYVMDSDHRLLLRCTKPLLQSRNSAVVMAVAQLYYHVAPKTEIQIVVKALIRLLRHHRWDEIQTIVLKSVMSMADKHKEIFEPHLKSFYIHSTDNGQVKRYKLEILTILANASNISTILREFQTYVLSTDKDFGAQTIHAIGRCASTIKEVTEACLNGLVALMSKKDEAIVAESVVVIKKLLQINPSQYSEIIKHIVRMVDKVVVPTARASILWLIGEYSDRISKLAPDVLRKMVKNFTNEETIVKQQILNLAAKLYVVNPKQTQLLVQYVFNLAKYDKNYDTRDKARLLRALLIQTEKCPHLSKYAKKILLASKPAPTLESSMRDNEQYTLGTLSHIIGQKANGYKDLPDFPLELPDPTVRNVEVILPEKTIPVFGQMKKGGRSSKATSATKGKMSSTVEGFYSEGESTDGPDPSEEESSTDTSEESLSESEVEEDDEKQEETEENNDEDQFENSRPSLVEVGDVNEYEQLESQLQQVQSATNTKRTIAKSSSESSSEESDDEESKEEDETSEDDEEEKEETKELSGISSKLSSVRNTTEKDAISAQSKKDNVLVDERSLSNETSLLAFDLETFLGSGPTTTTSSVANTTTQSKLDDLNILESLSSAPSVLAYTRQFELLNRINGSGSSRGKSGKSL
ncbi:unnamed protein product, partial [Didymodactylos carnosus]